MNICKRVLVCMMVLSICVLACSCGNGVGELPLSTDKYVCTESEKILDVPLLCQYPLLPTGCEAVAATMVLRYYGSTVTPETFAEDWLQKDERFWEHDNMLYGPNPHQVFVGNPFSKTAYGCYATPIVNAINDNSVDCIAQKTEKRSLSQLASVYIDNGKPLLIWATISMRPSEQGNAWFLESGEKLTWISGEHCLALVGYNDKYYFFNDPQSGGVVAYPKEISEKRFEELGAQAVYISPRNR